MSLAVTPLNGLNSSPNCTTLSSAFITGGSFTITFIVFVASPPLLSFTLYVTSYSPEVFVSTVFFTTSISVIFPSSLSLAVTPVNGSKLSPNCTTLSSTPITGGSFTITFIVFVASPPLLSFTLYVTSYSPEVFVSTVFFITSISVISPSSLSLAVTPSSSLNSSPNCTTLSSVFITGGSFTITFIVFVASPPLLSFTLYVTSYSPEVFVSTVFFITSISVISPSSLSLAVTPSSSLNSSPNCTTLSSAFITGGSFTITFIVFIALAPSVSVTLYVTSYFPDTFILTSFFITFIFEVIFPSSLSLAVTPSSSLNSSPNCITLSSAFITGILFIKDALGFTTTAL